MDIIVGTAGHIDHGKTALVKALTGVDADRLPEEKERGITIDLGFAELDLGDAKIGFVDVPGHERFVKNMLAGASGIDLVLLVIAADEGVMPQTHEHFEICRLLGIENGVVVLSKGDLVDTDFLDLVKLDVADLVEKSFLEDAPVITVSSKTGDGIDELKNALTESLSKIPERGGELVTRLSIDRTFSVKGFGAVVTGTLAAGEIEVGTEIELLPIGKRVRVRGVQTYGKDVEKAFTGQRTAVNLAGIDHTDIKRGMLLSETDTLRSTQVFDAEVEVLTDAKRPLKSRQRVRVHLGTVEALARIQVLNHRQKIDPGDKDFVQIRLESPTVALPNERFILRQYSPQTTVAGGIILDAHAKKHRKKDVETARVQLEKLSKAQIRSDKPRILGLYLEGNNNGFFKFTDLQARTGWRREILRSALDDCVSQYGVIEAEAYFISRTHFEELIQRILREVEKHHKVEPLSRGILRETLREKTASHLPLEIFKKAISRIEGMNQISTDMDTVRARSHSQELSPDETSVKESLLVTYKNAGLQVPTLDDAIEKSVSATKLSRRDARKVFQLLLNSGELVKVSDSFYFSHESIDSLTKDLKKYADENSDNRLIGIPQFKELTGVSRKYAIPLLEYLDTKQVTRRAGNKRLIN